MNNDYLYTKLAPLIEKGWEDDAVLEAQCNADGQLWFVTRDKGTICQGTLSLDTVSTFVHTLAQYHDAYLTVEKPYLDTTLPFQGERVNIKIPPLVSGPAFILRKPAKCIFTLDEYVEQGVVTQTQANFLHDAIVTRKNILVSGRPGSGKTTFVNALLDTLAKVSPVGHRVLMLEQVPELQCRVANHECWQTTDTVSMTQLLWLAMRNSPERIIVGEVRDGAALDCLKAWNTGYPGGIATVHANSAVAAIQRMLDLSQEVVANAPITLAAQSLDIIVHIEPDASHPAGRRLSECITVQGYDALHQVWKTQSLNQREESVI